MHTTNSYQSALTTMRLSTGIVIPVYFPKGDAAGDAADYLTDTVSAFVQQVDDPMSICLSVDGNAHGAEIAAELAQQFGVQIVVGEENHGKLQAARQGVDLLIERPGLSFVAIVDQDGDHFANELLNFIRAGEHVQRQSFQSRVLVLGRRISRHRPMGFPRGEIEELADRVMLDALHYHGAVTGRPLRLEYATLLDEFPDFHSGYKLFDIETARRVFLSEPQLCGVSGSCYYRHGVESVMSVEAILSDAILVVVNRSTLNQQPHSTFGLMHRQQLAADKMIWPLRRLQVPETFVRQFLDNHLPRLLLDTVVPDGQAELREIRRLVLEAFGLPDDESPIRRPLFL